MKVYVKEPIEVKSVFSNYATLGPVFRLINRRVGFFSPEGRQRELLQHSLHVSRVLGNSSVTVASCLWNFTICG